MTNAQASLHNIKKLNELSSDKVIINSCDSKRDLHTCTTNVSVRSASIHDTGGLASSQITIAEGARWMLT